MRQLPNIMIIRALTTYLQNTYPLVINILYWYSGNWKNCHVLSNSLIVLLLDLLFYTFLRDLTEKEKSKQLTPCYLSRSPPVPMTLLFLMPSSTTGLTWKV